MRLTRPLAVPSRRPAANKELAKLLGDKSIVGAYVIVITVYSRASGTPIASFEEPLKTYPRQMS